MSYNVVIVGYVLVCLELEESIMKLVNFSSHPLVKSNLVQHINQSSEPIDADVMGRFRSMAQTYDDLYGEQAADISEQH